ncbi:restriction endonuclease subunit S [uncultured Psychrobacter sp.]|uniref:restriction endonuclease subunit S n=1 Tax=uncultured Psychrobacter sp. TaxID=259303 RepID=UPI00261EC45F|nr:restriction endonuclease subunit S [uncultured Psychrobacter sp.]
MSKWTKRTLGDISDSCLGKMLDKKKNKGDLYLYLANYNVRWGEFDLNHLKEMRFEDHEHERYGLEYGDLVICEGGEPGRCAVWRDELSDMKIQKALHRLRVKKGFDYNFLFYRMLLAHRTGELSNYFIGSTIKHLTGVSLRQVEFEFPNLKTQTSIASILRLLDKKIELNNQINTELEAMAKTLYDYWFVQFDFPDADGQPYKSSGGKMVYNEVLKREIPEGWAAEKLSENLSIGSGYSFNSREYTTSGTYKIITIKNVQDYGLTTDNTDFVDRIPDKIPDYCKLEKGDILISLTGNVGRLCIVNEDNLLLNQRVGKFLCKDTLKVYFYLLFLRPESRMRLENIATGSSQKNLSPIDTVNLYQALPSEGTILNFNSRVASIFESILNNSVENQQLSSLRDWLLPMLLNGQVTVK